MASGDAEGSPKAKKRKIEQTADNIFHTFFNDGEVYDKFLKEFALLLTHPNYSILPSVITSCDAPSTPSRYGRSFNQCECIAEAQSDTMFHLGAFFERGINIYNSLKRKEIPCDDVLKKAARKLLTYIVDGKEWLEEMINIHEATNVSSETQVMVTLAEHFFKQLSLGKGYVMDKYSRKTETCKCGKCNNLSYDDTSIGNIQVWHGCLDVLFDSCDIAVKVSPEIEDDESPGGRSTVEVKKLENLDNIHPRSQIMAQTIVFSMLQKQRHPCFKHFLTPCIIANNTALKIFFYDAENDILLESNKFVFVENKKLSFPTAIAAWLVLNHRVLCTGAYKECIEKAPKANFKALAGDSLSIYEDNLMFRNVFKPQELKNETFNNWCNLILKGGTFKWPPSVEWPEDGFKDGK